MQRPFPAYQGDEPFLFVSYAHDDSSLIFPEMSWLRDSGLNLWYDEGIQVGAEWRQALVDAIAGCSGLIFFATARSVVSANCIRELNFAVDENKPVYVVKLDDAALPDVLRLSLSDRQPLVRADFDESAYRERLLAVLQGETLGVAAQGAQTRGRWAWLSAGAVAVALSAVGYLLMRDTQATPELTNPVQVTSATGVEEYPTWDPSGEMLAYHSNEDGDWDIYVRRLGSSRAINLTNSHTGHDMFPSWSPDGSQIAFWSDRDEGGYYRMDALTGDQPHKVRATDVDALASLRYKPVGPPRWSPDGQRLLYVLESKDGGTYAEVQSLASGETSDAIAMTGAVPGFDPAWATDRELIAYVAGWHREYETSAIRIADVRRPARFDSVAVTGASLHHLSPSWLGERSVIYIANRGFSRDLWLQPLNDDLSGDGPAVRLTTGINMRQASLSPDGSRLAYSNGRRVSNVWRVPVFADRPATWADAQQITFDQAWIEFIDVSPDGKELVVSSDRAGNKDLWRIPLTGGDIVQLTKTQVPEWAASWSPDGEEIAYYAYYQGKRNLFITGREGGSPTRVTLAGVEQAFVPTWSPDGSRIAFRGIDSSNNNDIYAWVRETGELQRLTRHPAMDSFARWGPDGTLTFVSIRENESRVWRASLSGDPPVPISSPEMHYHDWAPDGSALYVLGVRGRGDDVWELTPAGGERLAADLAGGRRGHIGSEAFATDGEYLYFTWEDDLGDIWVMDVAWN